MSDESWMNKTSTPIRSDSAHHDNEMSLYQQCDFGDGVIYWDCATSVSINGGSQLATDSSEDAAGVRACSVPAVVIEEKREGGGGGTTPSNILPRAFNQYKAVAYRDTDDDVRKGSDVVRVHYKVIVVPRLVKPVADACLFVFFGGVFFAAGGAVRTVEC